MRIMHLCLSNYYTEGYLYQENALPLQNHIDGHDVRIVALTEVLDSTGGYRLASPGSSVNEHGIQVTRLEYAGPRSMRRIMRKIRMYRGLKKQLIAFMPDVVLFHGSSALELLTIFRYKRRNPTVKVFVDSHADLNNSGQSWASRMLLHRAFYGTVLRLVAPALEKILFISLDARQFLTQIYRVDDSLLEYYPLGGFVIDEREWEQRRWKCRLKLGLSQENILIVHAGKMGPLKRTLELVEAIRSNSDPRLRLVLAGSMTEEIAKKLLPMIDADDRISFVGWQSPDELTSLLCSAELYAQPGSQSANAQHAICCGTPVLLDDVPSHHSYVDGNGFLTRTQSDMESAIKIILQNNDVSAMRHASLRIARSILDYERLAQRLYVK